jgi:hypothetical protein
MKAEFIQNYMVIKRSRFSPKKKEIKGLRLIFMTNCEWTFFGIFA